MEDIKKVREAPGGAPRIYIPQSYAVCIMMMSFAIVNASLFTAEEHSIDLSASMNSTDGKTKTGFPLQNLNNGFMFPVLMLIKCHVFAHFNNTSASLLRCACIFTTNSTEGIA